MIHISSNKHAYSAMKMGNVCIICTCCAQVFSTELGCYWESWLDSEGNVSCLNFSS
uniref:Uncharacterized protein n=1 Tax=Arion vulgaris TaxID=1028688 RepID=A0A0B6Z8J7_9EUPU